MFTLLYLCVSRFGLLREKQEQARAAQPCGCSYEILLNEYFFSFAPIFHLGVGIRSRQRQRQRQRQWRRLHSGRGSDFVKSCTFRKSLKCVAACVCVCVSAGSRSYVCRCARKFRCRTMFEVACIRNLQNGIPQTNRHCPFQSIPFQTPSFSKTARRVSLSAFVSVLLLHFVTSVYWYIGVKRTLLLDNENFSALLAFSYVL